jgi:hypothetical protein
MTPAYPPVHPGQFPIDLEEKIMKDGVRKAIRERRVPSHAIREYRKVAESKPPTSQGGRIKDHQVDIL